MDKEKCTEWFKSLNDRLAKGEIDQKTYESLITSKLSSIITGYVRTWHDKGHKSVESHFELINHYFELIADTEISERNARTLICYVASSISALPAAQAFGRKHNTPLPLLEGMFDQKPGLARKRVVSTTDAMIGRPVITQVNKPENEVTIELPWKTALHVYRGFLIKHLAAKHGYSFSDAYQYIDDHLNKYNSILEEALNSIISHKESHLVSAGGGITAAGTGLVVSGVIKPEE